MRTSSKAFVLIVILILFIFYVKWGTENLVVRHRTLSFTQLPSAFSGFRLAHISDLHNAEFGKNNENLIEMVKQQRPDMIVITGDLIDSRHTDVKVAVDFLKSLVNEAPIYYVTGNHESRIPQAYNILEEEMLNMGVQVLRDDTATVRRGEAQIQIIGLDDVTFYEVGKTSFEERISQKLQQLKSDDFSILLAHRPEYFKSYVRENIDLILSGHTHGGQVRLTLIGAIAAPNQGLFPQYDKGLYQVGEKAMVISGGLGNSVISVRFLNPPELLMVELQNKEKSLSGLFSSAVSFSTLPQLAKHLSREIPVFLPTVLTKPLLHRMN